MVKVQNVTGRPLRGAVGKDPVIVVYPGAIADVPEALADRWVSLGHVRRIDMPQPSEAGEVGQTGEAGEKKTEEELFGSPQGEKKTPEDVKENGATVLSVE